MRLTRKQLKIEFWSFVGLVVIAFSTITCQDQIPIQFTDRAVRSDYYGALIITIPCALVMATGLHHKIWGKRKLPIGHVVFGLFVSGFLLITAALMNALSNSWVDRQELFRGRFTNKEIILQHSAWSNNPRFIKITPIFPGLRYATPVDTCGIPEHKWVRLSKAKNSN